MFYHDSPNCFIKFIEKKKTHSSLSTFHRTKKNDQKKILYVLSEKLDMGLSFLRKDCLKRGLPDPLTPMQINGENLKRCIFLNGYNHIFDRNLRKDQLDLFHRYLVLHREHCKLDVRVILVLVMYGRNPKKIKYINQALKWRALRKIDSFLSKVRFGKTGFFQFSRPFSIRELSNRFRCEQYDVKKFERFARIYFLRKRSAILGPGLIDRQSLFEKIIRSSTVEKTIKNEAKYSQKSIKKIKKNIYEIMQEISADFSYVTIQYFDRMLSWIGKKFFQNLYVSNVEKIQNLAEHGYEIIYLPCHRSHLDYLLLSYIIYNRGLFPPHIVAGINLDFWPIGSIFRKLGAFFVRRTFKKNKLYFILFREYIGELFSRGYSVEYFIEGGRSRTGKLLKPKTGIITMMIQFLLRGMRRRIALIPIHIGYEHIIEEDSYKREILYEKLKKKESLLNMILGLFSLRNLGYGYVNFGDPILLTEWISKKIPNWKNFIQPGSFRRPDWLIAVVNEIAQTIMIRINQSVTIHSVNLCINILLSSHHHLLTRVQFLKQLNRHLDLLKNVPYSPKMIVSNQNAEEMLDHAISMKKCTIKFKKIYSESIIFFSEKQKISGIYYRNSIQHLFILPAVIANLIRITPGINRRDLYKKISLIYPFLKEEFFMRYEKKELLIIVEKFIQELIRQKLIYEKSESFSPNLFHIRDLQLLGRCVQEVLCRYYIVFSLLKKRHPNFTIRKVLEESSRIAKKISISFSRNYLEFFDRKAFLTCLETARSQKILDEKEIKFQERTNEICCILSDMIDPIDRSLICKLIYSRSDPFTD